MPAPPRSPLLPSLREGLVAKPGGVPPVKSRISHPGWAAAPGTAEPGRIRPSGAGGGHQAQAGWGGDSTGDPGAVGKAAPRGAAVPGGEKWGILEEFPARKVGAIGIRMENPLQPGQPGTRAGAGGPARSPPGPSPMLVDAEGLGGLGKKTPTLGKETLGESIPSVAGACRVGTPEISRELHSHRGFGSEDVTEGPRTATGTSSPPRKPPSIAKKWGNWISAGGGRSRGSLPGICLFSHRMQERHNRAMLREKPGTLPAPAGLHHVQCRRDPAAARGGMAPKAGVGSAAGVCPR